MSGLVLVIAAFFASAAASGQATHFSVTVSPTAPTAGSPFTVTVTALDSSGSQDKSYKGNHTLTFSGADPAPDGITQPSYPQHEPVPFDQGVASVPVTLFKAASTTLTVAEDNTTITGTTSPSFTVNPGPAAALSFTGGQPPKWVAKNQNFSAAVTVKDAWGNFVPDHPVTVALAGGATGGPNGATLTCDPNVPYCTEGPLTSKSNTSGVASFLLKVNRDSVGYYLIASGSPAQSANSDTFSVGDAYASFANGTGPFGSDEPATTQTSTNVNGSNDNNLALTVDSSIPVNYGRCGGLPDPVGSGTVFEAVKTSTSNPQPTWTITVTVKKAALVNTARGAATYDMCLGTRNIWVASGGATGTNNCVPNSATSFSTSLSWLAKGGVCATDDGTGVYWGNMPNAGDKGTNTPANIKDCSQARTPVVMSKSKTGPGDLVMKLCVPFPWDGAGGFH